MNVPYERIRDADKEPGNWLTYSRDYTGHRYSPLDQINTGNVGKLRIAWMRQVNELDTFETSPIVVDGTMFITEPPNVVAALDARTGRALWSYRKELPNDLRLCCGKVNRGLAILGDTVYYGSTDAHLIALDARTGELALGRDMADYKNGYSGTGAPLAVKDKIITGMAGGEFGVRGFIDAYDAKTGKRAWRFNTIPAKGEPGNETWEGESWKTGSATTWVTGVYDPETNTVYWGTGNPGPDWNGDVRKGDNLYSDCLIALDPDTGAKKWHFQYTPHDVNDWDSTQTPILADAMVKGQPRKMVVLANRNGFYYALDRVTGKFIAGRPYVKQTWANGLDEAGRPMRAAEHGAVRGGYAVVAESRRRVQLVQLDLQPEDRSLLCEREGGGGHLSQGRRRIQGRRSVQRRRPAGLQGRRAYGAVRALEVATGKLRWEYKLHLPSHAGLMSTARRSGLRLKRQLLLCAGCARRAICCGDSRPAAVSTPTRSRI